MAQRKAPGEPARRCAQDRQAPTIAMEHPRELALAGTPAAGRVAPLTQAGG